MAGAEQVDTVSEFPVDEEGEAELLQETPETESTPIDVIPLRDALNLEREEGDSEAVHFVKVMRAVKPTLAAAGLTNAFHDMYLDISEEMLDATEPDDENPPDPDDPARRHFVSSDDVLQAMPKFGEMYFDPLNSWVAYHTGEDPEALEKVSPAWQEALIDPELKEMPEIVVAYSGLLAHVNADLRESLRRTNPSDEYRDDYTTVVNNRIDELSTKIIAEHFAAHPLAQRAAHAAFVKMINYQRDAAYDSYLDLKALQETAEQHGPGTQEAINAEDEMDFIRWQANERTAEQIILFKRVGTPVVNALVRLEEVHQRMPWKNTPEKQAA